MVASFHTRSPPYLRTAIAGGGREVSLPLDWPGPETVQPALLQPGHQSPPARPAVTVSGELGRSRYLVVTTLNTLGRPVRQEASRAASSAAPPGTTPWAV